MVDDQLIHSKLSTNAFPDFDEVANIVQSVAEGSKPQQVIWLENMRCAPAPPLPGCNRKGVLG
ncbi:hypothetical protein OUZ56_013818 [Daphnia magna]|uniref:Uncharacterized protein n=1 Tax=Daphnia magna TaxID=35525 RepID=A0ABQ9Z714_9CRUS|nr:hypothetical protein OUZ56_013818 [Daphnia magna]